MSRLIFRNPTKEQLEHIGKAQAELILAGVTFDTGCDLDGKEIIARVWELDWSLQGAEIVA